MQLKNFILSQFLSRESGFELRFRQLSRDRNLESRMKIQYSILNTLYVIFYNQKLDHFKHLTSYEPSRSKTQRHSDFWQFDYASYDRKVCDLINK